MATNGLISIVKNGSVVTKIVSGCDGYYVGQLKSMLLDNIDCLDDLDKLYEMALSLGLGSEDCLVVLSKNDTKTRAWFDDVDEQKYRINFGVPEWNPRTRNGAHEYYELIEV